MFCKNRRLLSRGSKQMISFIYLSASPNGCGQVICPDSEILSHSFHGWILGPSCTVIAESCLVLVSLKRCFPSVPKLKPIFTLLHNCMFMGGVLWHQFLNVSVCEYCKGRCFYSFEWLGSYLIIIKKTLRDLKKKIPFCS